MLLATIAAMSTVAAVGGVVVGWRRSLHNQLRANRQNNKIQMMLAYQKLLQERYEIHLTAIAPFIYSSDLAANFVKQSESLTKNELLNYIHTMHEDARELETAYTPYYFALQANVLLDNQVIVNHYSDTQVTLDNIRRLLGHPKEPVTKGVSVDTILEIHRLQLHYVESVYEFMRFVNDSVLREVGRE